jgi:hypothetical protein
LPVRLLRRPLTIGLLSAAGRELSSFRKLNTVLEEIDESTFWLEFSVDTKMVRPEAVADLSKEAAELAAIVCASRATARKNGAQIPRQ